MRKVREIDISGIKTQQLKSFFAAVELIVKSIYGTETCHEAKGFLEAFQAYELTIKGCSRDEAELLQASDDAADEAWGALNEQIRASLRHPNPAKRSAAASAFMIFAEFNNPVHLNYDEEYAIIRQQIDALRKLPAETLQLALIDEHVDALENCYNNFMKDLAFVQDGSKRPALCKEAREKTREAYRQFVETLNVMVRLHEDEKYAQLVDGLNTLIEKQGLR